jgi:hypothetical protein
VGLGGSGLVAWSRSRRVGELITGDLSLSVQHIINVVAS